MVSADQQLKDVLPDVLVADLDLVFCGTAPSNTSAAARAYYANPRNRFWEILHECKFTDAKLEPHEFLQLKSKKIGLTDLCKFVFGSDDKLPPDAFLQARLEQAIEKYRPRYLAFTSCNAGQKFLGRNVKYGPQRSLGDTKVFVLPTTSPRRGSAWWSENKHHWLSFAKEFHASFDRR